MEQLTTARKMRGTFRGRIQVEAEAEVLHIIRRVRSSQYTLPVEVPDIAKVYFVSQSRALDIVAPDDPIVTWTPEAVYRYASSVTGGDIDPNLLQQCMLHEYFYAGVSFIDKARYLKFFGPAISQAKVSYKEQVDRYVHESEHLYRRTDLDEAFDRTPDLQKPFFVAQMGWQLARQAEAKARKATEHAVSIQVSADRKVKQAQAQTEAALARAKAADAEAEGARKAKARAETEANRLRNLQDAKHGQKRARQAKKRRRDKRK